MTGPRKATGTKATTPGRTTGKAAKPIAAIVGGINRPSAKSGKVTPQKKENSQARYERNKRRSEGYTAELTAQLAAKGCPSPELEYQFRSDRMWRFDLCWPNFGVVAEIEGGVYRGRHTSAAGFQADAIKYAAAAIMGYVVIRVTPGMIKDGVGAIFVAELLRISGAAGIPAQRVPWSSAGDWGE